MESATEGLVTMIHACWGMCIKLCVCVSDFQTFTEYSFLLFVCHCLQAPDASKLSQEFLLKAASAQTADAVSTLLSQTAHSLIEAEKKYRFVGFQGFLCTRMCTCACVCVSGVCEACVISNVLL